MPHPCRDCRDQGHHRGFETCKDGEAPVPKTDGPVGCTVAQHKLTQGALQMLRLYQVWFHHQSK